jgi:hypothetical protein
LFRRTIRSSRRMDLEEKEEEVLLWGSLLKKTTAVARRRQAESSGAAITTASVVGENRWPKISSADRSATTTATATSPECEGVFREKPERTSGRPTTKPQREPDVQSWRQSQLLPAADSFPRQQ